MSQRSRSNSSDAPAPRGSNTVRAAAARPAGRAGTPNEPSARGPGQTRPARRDPGISRSGRKQGTIVAPLEVSLEHGRWRHFSWALLALIGGGVLTFKFGTVINIIGVILLLLAGRSAFLFVRTLVKPAGTIRIDRELVVLPRGLCRGPILSFALNEIRHAYLLRRAVDWTETAPILVVETESAGFTYPRNWFHTELDQRRVMQAIHAFQGPSSSHAGDSGEASESAAEPASP